MKLKIKGKQYIYTHECEQDEIWRLLSTSEMQRFVTDCLIKSYAMRGTDCILHIPDFNSEADFSYTKLGKTVCGIVKYGLSKEEESELFDVMFNEERFQKTFPQLYKGFHEYNSYPVFYFADVRCLDTKDGTPVAGGCYEIEWTPIQPLYTVIPTSGPNISEFEMYKGYAHSWETGDVTFINDYVNSWFYGVSDLSFECTTSKAELIALIKSHHENWCVRQISIQAKLIKDTDSGDNGILILLNGKPTGFVTLEFRNYRISKSNTKIPPANYVDWETKHDLYQTHGDHHAPFVEDGELHVFLKDVMEKSLLYVSLDSDVAFDDLKTNTRVASLRYSADNFAPDVAYLALIAYNPAEEVNEFVSCYPYLKGRTIEVEIIDIFEWSNEIEATIKCKYCFNDDDDNEFVFHFFATDYYLNKGRYRIGEKLWIALAASSGNAQEASKGFSFEGQKAIDFLSKIGKEPTFDKNGVVEPINFSTAQLVAFLPQDDKSPDMAEFQSPIDNIRHEGFYHNQINVCTIKLHNDPDLEVPLYFNGGLKLQNGEPVMGWLWLTGRISRFDSAKISVSTSIASLKFAKIAEQFIIELSKVQERSIIDVTRAFNILTDLSIPDGKSVFAVRLGNEFRYNYELMVLDFSELTLIQSMLNHEGCIEYDRYEEFSRFVKQSESTIKAVGELAPLQYFLVATAGRFMPYKKYYSQGFIYIFTKGEADNSSIAIKERYSSLSLLPHIFPIGDSAGNFTVMAWSRGRLLRRVYVYSIYNGQITFNLDGSYEVEDITDNDFQLLFRE